MNIIQKIKAIFALRSAVNQIKEANMKSGFQSTEFWLNLVTILGTVYGSISGFVPTELMAKVVAVLVIAYTLARSLVKVAEIVVKMTASAKDDAVVAGIQKVLDKIQETFIPKAIN